MPNKNDQQDKRPALKKEWIVPIRLAVYAALAGTSAYVFFNYKELEWTHFMFLVPIVIVASMISLDCKMSQKYWDEQERLQKSSREESS